MESSVSSSTSFLPYTSADVDVARSYQRVTTVHSNQYITNQLGLPFLYFRQQPLLILKAAAQQVLEAQKVSTTNLYSHNAHESQSYVFELLVTASSTYLHNYALMHHLSFSTLLTLR
jgi:hypothetical protein